MIFKYQIGSMTAVRAGQIAEELARGLDFIEKIDIETDKADCTSLEITTKHDLSHKNAFQLGVVVHQLCPQMLPVY